ncbi:hypothetical protein VTN96DRAFT_1642 [Rasamsonia emersonii]
MKQKRNRGQGCQHSGTPERDGEGALQITAARGEERIRSGRDGSPNTAVWQRNVSTSLGVGLESGLGRGTAAHRSYRLFPFPPEAPSSLSRPGGPPLQPCTQRQGGALQPT